METTNQKISFYFDPQRQGYDAAMWSTLAGNPQVNGLHRLEISAATAVGTADLVSGEVTFDLVIPAAPVAGITREWGVYQPNSLASVKFRCVDDAFTAYTSDNDGGSASTALTFDPLWVNTATRFTVKFSPGYAAFYVNGQRLAVHNAEGCPNAPMPLYISNTNGDPLQIKTIQVRDAMFYSPGLQSSSSISGSGSGSGQSAVQTPYTQYESTSFTSVNIKASSGHVYSFTAWNTTANPRYLQLHNSAAAAAAGESAEWQILIPAGGIVGIGTDIFGTVGKFLSSGITIANSTTANTYTAGVAGDLAIDMFFDGALTTTFLLMENNDELLLENNDFMLQE